MVLSVSRVMPNTYKKSPLLEAVCEFRFLVEGDLSTGNVSAFYTAIQASFPKQKKGKMNKLEFHIDTEKTPEENKKNISQDYYEFEQYFSEDEKCSVQLDGGRVSIHRIKPYSSWANFLPLIQLVHNAYTTHFQPTEVSRIGIRYINEIILPSSSFIFSQYFALQASVPSLDANSRQSIFLGALYEQNEGRDAIKVQFADKQQNNPDIKAFILDLDYFLAKPVIPITGLNQWLGEAHTNLEIVFEGMLAENAKVIFDA